ncbi:MAG: hypothetical protein ACREKL_01815, partial [Chthoniobacterales bacterium]
LREPMRLAFIVAAVSLRGADISRLTNFPGKYETDGKVSVVSGRDKPITGMVKMRFTIAKDGKSARLKISGKLDLPDETKNQFSTSLILRGGRRAIFTNLAPGFEDRRSGKGIYSASRQRISAKADLVFTGVRGGATFLVELQRVGDDRRLSVVQTLDTSELAQPITWKFSALRDP